MKKFDLGRLVMTRAIADKMQTDESFSQFVQQSIDRYVKCDWGSMADEDKAMNDEAVENGEIRIHAAYVNKAGVKIWIITEWDRSVTTILFPSDY